MELIVVEGLVVVERLVVVEGLVVVERLVVVGGLAEYGAYRVVRHPVSGRRLFLLK